MTKEPAEHDRSERRPDEDSGSKRSTDQVTGTDAHDEGPSSSKGDGSRWGLLAIAGLCGLCCVGLATLGGGAAVIGGTAAGVTAANGAIGSLGGALVVGLATALPLFVIGLFLRRRGPTS